MKNGSDLLLALLAGGVIGVGVGMLYAPRKGVDTRKKIAAQAQEAKARLQQQVGVLEEQAIDYYLRNKESWDIHVLSLLSRLTGHSIADLIATLEQKLGVVREISKKFHTKERIIDVTASSVTD